MPGSDFVVTLVVDAEHEVPASAVHVHLIGRQRSTDPETTVTREHLHLTASLRPPRLVLPGRHHYDCRFTLPDALPPSYDGRTFEVLYVVEVRLVIPWWADAQGAWTVQIDEAPATATPPGEPQSRSVPENPGPDDALLELSLDASVVAAGDALSGEIALTNVAAARQRGFELTLYSLERHPATADHRVEAERFAFPRLTARSEDGHPVPFEITLPRGLTPSFSTALGGLYWFVEVLVLGGSSGFAGRGGVAPLKDIRWLSVRLPITVVAHGGAAQRARVAAPVIGSQHLRSLWDTVASRAGLSHAEGRLFGTLGDTALSVTREQRGSRRLLVGELGFPPLRLGLRAEPRRGLFTRSRGLRPDETGHDPLYYIDARDQRQAAHLLTTLAPALRALPEASLSDDHARFQLGDAGRHEERLLDLVHALSDFARLLTSSREHIPPPAALAAGIAHWHELATRLDAALTIADMSIEGSLRGVAAAVRANWSEGTLDAPGLTLEARTALPLDPRWYSDRVPLAAAELPPGGAALLARAHRGDDDAALEVSPHAVELHLSEAPADPRPLLAAVDALVELALLMRETAEPYR